MPLDPTPSLTMSKPILQSFCNSKLQFFAAKLKDELTVLDSESTLSEFELISNPVNSAHFVSEIYEGVDLQAVIDTPCVFIINNITPTDFNATHYVMVNSDNNTLAAYSTLSSPISVPTGKKVRIETILRLGSVGT